MKIIKVLLFLFIFTSVNAQTTWFKSLELAKETALADSKLILVQFSSLDCSTCDKMEKEFWNQPEILTLLNHYVLLKLDTDNYKELINRLDSKKNPSLFILDANGKLIFKVKNYKSKSKVKKALQDYSFNMLLVKNESLNFHKEETFATSFKLAVKYSDFIVLLVDKNVKNSFIDLKNNYFNISKVLLENSKTVNVNYFNQKLELYKIQELLILKKADKALYNLDKFGSNLTEGNKQFHNLLLYITYSMLGYFDHALLLEDKLSDNDLLKAQLFLKE